MTDSKLIDLHLTADRLAKEAQVIADLFINLTKDDIEYIAQDIADLISEYNKLRASVLEGI